MVLELLIYSNAFRYTLNLTIQNESLSLKNGNIV